MKKVSLAVWVVLLISIYLVITSASASVPAFSHNAGEMKTQYAEAYGKLPLSFIKNDGQLNKAVRYVVNGPTASAFFTDTGVTFDLADPSALKSKSEVTLASYRPEKPVKHTALKMEFVGASSNCRLMGVGKLPGKVNIIRGKDSSDWQTGISTYKGIIYKNAWKGIDVAYAGNRKQVKYDIIVNPGAKVSDIKLRYTGADKIWLDAKGDLNIKTAVSSFTENVPGIFQTKAGKQTALKGGYVLLDDHTVGFKVKGADSTLPIIIDPASDLVYSTFIGGTAWEYAGGVAVDNAGYIYVGGITGSTAFRTTAGAYDTTLNSTYDVFVTKLNPSMSSLVYSTFIGGSNTEATVDLEVDSNGYAYITGYTLSTNFPTTEGAFDRTYNSTDSSFNIFVTKLNTTGSGLVYSTYVGGNSNDNVGKMCLDNQGCAYITGNTCSNNFPTTQNAFSTTHHDEPYNQYVGYGYDAFVTKLNSTGTGLVYSTYIGGGKNEGSLGIKVDEQGNAYITGSTYSPDFPTTSGSYDSTFNGQRDAYVAKLNSTGSGLIYSTLIGTDLDDGSAGIDIDKSGCAYITGETNSQTPDLFPTTLGAFDRSSNFSYKVFVTKFNSEGSDIEYSTLFGGQSSDKGIFISVDDEGYAYIVGGTGSADLPVTDNAYDSSFNGGTDRYKDIFIMKINQYATNLEYASYLGGTEDDGADDMFFDKNGFMYIVGVTSSSDFPATSGILDSSYNGNVDGFITKFYPGMLLIPDLLMKSGSSSYGFNNIYSEDGSTQTLTQNASMNQTVTYSFRVQNDGNAADTFKITGTAGGSGWTVKYCDITTNADVTAQVTGSGWSSGSLAPGATNGVYVLITPNNTVAAGSAKTLVINAISQSDTSKKDVGKAVTTAVATYKSDILVKAGAETSYSFNNIYSTDGSNQIKSQSVSANQTVSYGFRVQNDGNASDTFKITGPAGTGGWTVRYYDLTTNADVTSQVTGSGWSSGTLAPGATNGVYVKVTPNNTAASGSVNTLLITAVSQGNTSNKDVCKTLTTAVSTRKTDILMKAGGEILYSFDNIYGTDGSNQTKSLNASANQKVNFAFRVQNDGNIADTFYITGPAGGSGWTVKYCDLNTNADVTAQVTGSGWVSGSLAPGATGGVYVFVTPDGTVPAGNNKTLVITAVSQSDSSTRDVCKAVTCKQ